MGIYVAANMLLDKNRDDGKFFKVPVFLKLFLNALASNK